MGACAIDDSHPLAIRSMYFRSQRKHHVQIRPVGQQSANSDRSARLDQRHHTVLKRFGGLQDITYIGEASSSVLPSGQGLKGRHQSGSADIPNRIAIVARSTFSIPPRECLSVSGGRAAVLSLRE